jgi:hypothetical protein
MNKEEQQKLLNENKMIFLHKGPKGGWVMSADLYAKCTDCGYFMSMSPEEDDICFCGKLTKDTGMARFGSRLGDKAIEIYRIQRK